MLYHKKQLRNKIVTCIVISIFLISSFSIFNFSGTNIENNVDSEIDGPNNILSSAAFDIPFIGSGDDQEGRLYFEENSSSLGNNNGQFNIPAPATNTFLDYGDMYFEYDEDYTTEHIIEDHDALGLPLEDQINFGCTKQGSEMIINTGTIVGDFKNDLFGFDNNSYVTITSDGAGEIDFTIDSDFFGTSFETINYGTKDFVKEEILGFIMILSYNLTANADLTISMYDDSNSKWVNVVNQLSLLAGGPDEINRLVERIVNTNLKFINGSDYSNINFLFEGTGTYDISLHEFSVNATYAFQADLDYQYPLALELDIRGNNTLLNGFYAWIRTVNYSAAETTELNITLYKSNKKVINRNNLNADDDAIPNTLISDYSISYVNYTEDKIDYFKFETTLRLDLYNYFIRIDVNNSDVYKLVTLDSDDESYGDDEEDHILKRYTGTYWERVRININPGVTPYTTGFLDASSFKLNITRGYMPSDFIYDDVQTQKIDGISVEGTNDPYFDYSVADGYQWGLGKWNNTFNNAITNGGSSDFTVTLTWNNSEIIDFYFDVFYYVRAYSKHNVGALYSTYYNEISEWAFTFTASFSGYTWDFVDLWFVYNKNFESTSLYTPLNGTVNALEDTNGEQILNSTHDKLILPYEMVEEIDGVYELNTTSYNAIDKVYSYLDYSGNLWENQGFMNGDVMKIGADIRGDERIAPNNGDINATLYFPDGSIYIYDLDLTGTLSSNGEILSYTFNNDVFLNVDHPTTHSGTYNLGMIWNNGTSIGCKSIPIYFDEYNITFGDLTFNQDLDYNLLSLEEISKITDLDSRDPQEYDLYLASINQTSSFPADFYAINNSEINQEYIYESYIGDLTINLQSFLQNESIINPDENIKFKITLENRDPIIDINLKVSVELVSLLNNQWIIANDTSPTQVLKQSGDPNGDNIKDFMIDFNIPIIQAGGIWDGVNAPIRMGGAKAIVKIFLDDEIIGIYECPDYALLVEETEDLFEGYIISLKSSLSSKAIAFEKIFNREDCTYNPQNTVILLNIIDKNSLSSYSPFLLNQTLNEASKFTEVTITPELPTKGNEFNISSILTSEFGTPISGVEIICQYNNSGIWTNITDSPKTSDSIGYTKFTIDTEGLGIGENNITIKLKWQGTSLYLNETHELTIDFFSFTDLLLVRAGIQGSTIVRNKKNYLQIEFTNIGDSILNITDITLDFTDSGIIPPYEIVEQNLNLLYELRSGESTLVTIEIAFQNIATDILSFNISITAKNIETDLEYSNNLTIIAAVLDKSVFEDIIKLIMIPIILLIGLIWVAGLLYSFRLKKKIEKPVEKEDKRKPRKGRYVKVSEISKKTPQKEEKTPEKKKTTDLDSLLEEEGLED